MALIKVKERGRETVNLGRRNLIINGAMQIAQRGTSATGLGVSPGYYTVDRWRFADSNNPTARFTQTQSTDAPEGFSASHKYEVTTNDGATDANELQYTDHFIEAQNLQHLKYGTSNAESVTLSFYVKSSVASTMGVRFSHEDGGGSYGASYTINSVNTWERKSITVPGNTATAINDDNGRGMSIRFGLNIGSTYAGSNSTAWGNGSIFGAHTNTFVGTANATWQITGVQLEVGSSATDFEHRSIGEELAACQRYFEQQHYPANDQLCVSMRWSGYAYMGHITCMEVKRTEPTVSSTGIVKHMGQASFSNTVSPVWQYMTPQGVGIYSTPSSGPTGNAVLVLSEGITVNIDAEL